jgi:hypothetical protein
MPGYTLGYSQQGAQWLFRRWNHWAFPLAEVPSLPLFLEVTDDQAQRVTGIEEPCDCAVRRTVEGGQC